MRIIGGRFKGRRFNPPADKWPTRPTTDFAKEGLFNILENRLDWEQTRMLDLFGGTGSHSYEAISRGCRNVTYVDQFPACARFVRELAKTLDIEPLLSIVQMDVARFIRKNSGTYDYIFAGPPYPLPWLDDIPGMIFKSTLLSEEGLLVLEHNSNHHFESFPQFEQLRKYAGTHLSFFTANRSIDD